MLDLFKHLRIDSTGFHIHYASAPALREISLSLFPRIFIYKQSDSKTYET